MKTRIVSTDKLGKGKKSRKKWAKHLTKKVSRSHKGYSMRGIVKGQMTYKRKGRKR